MMDRVREALFNILAHRDWGVAGDVLDGTRVLDAFCGTGALAFEALSWGAAQATLFDLASEALKIARKNAESLGLKERADMRLGDALAPPQAVTACQLIFLAPPYRKNLIPPALSAFEKAGWIAPHALIVAETARDETLVLPEGYPVVLERSYADTTLRFAVRAV